MKNKKGFTLMELLAILVLIAVIAVITIPIILQQIEKSKRGAAYNSAHGIVETAKDYYYNLEDDQLEKEAYACSFPNECTELKFNGNKPTSGNIRISDIGIINGEVTFSDKYTYCIYKNEVLDGTCEETLAQQTKEELTKTGTHIYNPDGTLDIDKIYNCVQFDIEVSTGTTIPFCAIGETSDSITLITKENIGYSQWTVNDIYEKILTETKTWTNIPVVDNYSYTDSDNSAYKTLSIDDGQLTVVYRDDTQATIGSTSDTSNQLRARAITAEEAYGLINGTTNISDKITCNYPPTYLESTWTMTYGSTSSTSTTPGVVKKAYEIKNITPNRTCGIVEKAVSDTSNIKAIITVAKSSL